MNTYFLKGKGTPGESEDLPVTIGFGKQMGQCECTGPSFLAPKQGVARGALASEVRRKLQHLEDHIQKSWKRDRVLALIPAP